VKAAHIEFTLGLLFDRARPMRAANLFEHRCSNLAALQFFSGAYIVDRDVGKRPTMGALASNLTAS
jgi:hypothetical protein